jgi:hypothetical protein
MCKLPRCVAVVVGLLCVRAIAAQAATTGLTIDPPYPSSREVVHLTVTGQGPLCSQQLVASVTEPADLFSTGAIRIGILACVETPLPQNVPFAQTVTVGPLREGSYTVETEDGPFTAQLTVRDVHQVLINSLFFLHQRFEVSVTWRTATAAGIGLPEALTDSSGYFWFFDPSNPELLIKLIDGRAVNGHFWVFLGGLSDVDYSVTVTDRATLKVRTYTNARGTVTSRADTSAF